MWPASSCSCGLASVHESSGTWPFRALQVSVDIYNDTSLFKFYWIALFIFFSKSRCVNGKWMRLRWNVPSSSMFFLSYQDLSTSCISCSTTSSCIWWNLCTVRSGPTICWGPSPANPLLQVRHPTQFYHSNDSSHQMTPPTKWLLPPNDSSHLHEIIPPAWENKFILSDLFPRVDDVIDDVLAGSYHDDTILPRSSSFLKSTSSLLSPSNSDNLSTVPQAPYVQERQTVITDARVVYASTNARESTI